MHHSMQVCINFDSSALSANRVGARPNTEDSVGILHFLKVQKITLLRVGQSPVSFNSGYFKSMIPLKLGVSLGAPLVTVVCIPYSCSDCPLNQRLARWGGYAVRQQSMSSATFLSPPLNRIRLEVLQAAAFCVSLREQYHLFNHLPCTHPSQPPPESRPNALPPSHYPCRQKEYAYSPSVLHHLPASILLHSHHTY